MTTIYDFEAATIEGMPQRLDAYRGQVLLIVNVASRCGFTPQYAALETIYRENRERGLAVLGFPCNQFGHQEPGDERQIKSFCCSEYDVTFPLFAKIEVNGQAAAPLYAYLKSQRSGLFGTRSIKWNFTKFLVDRAGKVVARYGPLTSMKKVERALARLLADPGSSGQVSALGGAGGRVNQ